MEFTEVENKGGEIQAVEFVQRDVLAVLELRDDDMARTKNSKRQQSLT